jgi:site-specific DNA-methyltransferase (adenine-specific)
LHRPKEKRNNCYKGDKMSYIIIQGDNRETLKTIPDNSIDAIVTDPPYGIDFLGKDWDANTGALETYQECLRVLKPGGHILAFSAARTYHHLAITLEQAGFEIRDQIMWIYSSGFPKSQDIGKSIERNEKKDGSDWLGWGTALKPAHEPIALARKPIKLSIAKNAQKYGVGALNIDAARVPYADEKEAQAMADWYAKYPVNQAGGAPTFQGTDDKPKAGKRTASFHNATGGGETQSGGDGSPQFIANEQGRFPSNVIGDIPLYQKYFYCPKVSRKERHIGLVNPGPQTARARDADGNVLNYAEKKAGASANVLVEQFQLSDKGNNHPTVKPIELMKYLIKLVTPPGGTVLDPFNGSGSTGCAAVELGHNYIGCELDPAYVDIANRRIAAWLVKDEPLVSETFANLFEEE